MIPHYVGCYMQVRIGGDFLSTREAARVEICPPETTAAVIGRSLMLSSGSHFSLSLTTIVFANKSPNL
jgi:hypothetical protein